MFFCFTSRPILLQGSFLKMVIFLTPFSIRALHAKPSGPLIIPEEFIHAQPLLVKQMNRLAHFILLQILTFH